MIVEKSTTQGGRDIIDVYLAGTPVYQDRDEKTGLGRNMASCEGFFSLTIKGAVTLAMELLQAVLKDCIKL